MTSTWPPERQLRSCRLELPGALATAATGRRRSGAPTRGSSCARPPGSCRSSGNPSVVELFRWTNREVGRPPGLPCPDRRRIALRHRDNALASARFVLSAKLTEHLSMPAGDFSLRTWLADPVGGNLFITWREDMAEARKPLISAWVDVLCTSRA